LSGFSGSRGNRPAAWFSALASDCLAEIRNPGLGEELGRENRILTLKPFPTDSAFKPDTVLQAGSPLFGRPPCQWVFLCGSRHGESQHTVRLVLAGGRPQPSRGEFQRQANFSLQLPCHSHLNRDQVEVWFVAPSKERLFASRRLWYSPLPWTYPSQDGSPCFLIPPTSLHARLSRAARLHHWIASLPKPQRRNGGEISMEEPRPTQREETHQPPDDC